MRNYRYTLDITTDTVLVQEYFHEYLPTYGIRYCYRIEKSTKTGGTVTYFYRMTESTGTRVTVR